MSASLNDLNKTGALACELAEAASRWDLDRLKYLDDIEQPNRIQLAFIQIYCNLQLYRPFIPDAVLQFNSAESQGPEDDDDDEIQENVTLVFTDIQNSTVLWETCGPAMRKAVKAHHAVMRRCIAQRDGYEVWPPTMPLTKGRAPCSWVVGRARLSGFMQQQCVAVGRCAWWYCVGLDWLGLDWLGLDWIVVDWIVVDWIGLSWIGLYCRIVPYHNMVLYGTALYLYCTMFYCTVLYCAVFYCTVFYGNLLYCIVLYSTCVLLYCTVLYCTVLYCTVLYCTVLYCTVLYCTVLYLCSVLPATDLIFIHTCLWKKLSVGSRMKAIWPFVLHRCPFDVYHCTKSCSWLTIPVWALQCMFPCVLG